MKKDSYTGINIQWPISELILKGAKTIETRKYPIPSKYINEEMLMIETPGKDGDFKARIVAVIKFESCFQYKNSKSFYSDIKRHLVSKESLWAWKAGNVKWGWEIKIVKKISPPIVLKQRKGIIYTTNVQI